MRERVVRRAGGRSESIGERVLASYPYRQSRVANEETILTDYLFFVAASRRFALFFRSNAAAFFRSAAASALRLAVASASALAAASASASFGPSSAPRAGSAGTNATDGFPRRLPIDRGALGAFVLIAAPARATDFPVFAPRLFVSLFAGAGASASRVSDPNASSSSASDSERASKDRASSALASAARGSVQRERRVKRQRRRPDACGVVLREHAHGRRERCRARRDGDSVEDTRGVSVGVSFSASASARASASAAAKSSSSSADATPAYRDGDANRRVGDANRPSLDAFAAASVSARRTLAAHSSSSAPSARAHDESGLSSPPSHNAGDPGARCVGSNAAAIPAATRLAVASGDSPGAASATAAAAIFAATAEIAAGEETTRGSKRSAPATSRCGRTSYGVSRSLAG